MAACSPNPNIAPDPVQMEMIVPKTEPDPEPDPDPSTSFGPVVKRDPVLTLISPVSGLEPLTWSQDHRLAASTTTAISLMELVCDVHSNKQDLILHRTSIPVPDKVLELKVGPTEQLAKARQKFSNHPDPAVSQLFMADRVINPFVGVHKGIKYTSWSPLGCDASGRCLLACLTLDHRLTIHSSHKRLQWTTLADLTQLYGESLENRGYSLQPSESSKASLMDLEELQRRFLMQTPVRMEWSSMCTIQHVQTNNKCKEMDTVLLAVLMENGDLVVWQFRLPFLGRDSVLSCNTIQSGVANPSVLAWWEYEHSGRKMSGLIVGSEVGPVKIMPVNLKAVKGYFTLRQPVVLWQEPDQIPVHNIKCVTLYHPIHMCNCSLVVAARGTYLFWCLLVISKAGLNVHNSHITGLHSLPIVSMAASRQLVSIFTCSMDGGVKKLTPIFTEKAIAFRQEAIVLPENLQSRRMHGIAVSPSGAYMALVSTEGISNGHHPVDRIYQVHFVTLKTPENAATMLLKSPLQNLYKQADLLDLVRWKVLKDKCIPLLLQKNLDQMVHNTGSTYLWRFKLFLVRMLYQSLQKTRADPLFKPSYEHSKVFIGDNEEEGEGDGGGGTEGVQEGEQEEWKREKEIGPGDVKQENTEEQMGEVQAWIEAVESHLIREHMKKVLGEVYLHTWITENTSIPTRGVCDYLSNDPTNDRNAEVLIGHVTKKMNKQTFPEYCSLCKEVLPFTDHKNATCVNGHMWLRCVLSYQACQTLTFRRCLLQDSIARLPVPEDPDWIKKILQGPCTFCDSPII